MRRSHPIHSISISSNILDCLLEEFDEIINSKRLRSRISQVSELVDILWKRNTLQTDQNALVTICKYLVNSEQRQHTRSYIDSLNQTADLDNTANVYGLWILIF